LVKNLIFLAFFNVKRYKVNLTNGQPLTVTVSFAKEIGSIFLELYDQNLNLVEQSLSNRGTQELTVTTTPQIYYIHVYLITEIATGRKDRVIWF
jgi:hypothetical protein